MNKPTIILTCISLALTITGIITVNQLTLSKHQYETQQICDQSRATTNAILKRACGRIQQQYNVEFLCTSQDSDASCWVENK